MPHLKSSATLILVCTSTLLFSQNRFFYQFMNDAMNLEKPMSYVGVANGFYRQENKRELTPEEGGDGFKVELNINTKFPILQRRLKYDSATTELIKPFWAYSRLWIDYGFHTRVARNVDSSPILPPTNRYGVRYDKLVHAKWVDGDSSECSFSFDKKVEHIMPKQGKLRFSFFSLYLHHYSNSMLDGVFKDNDPAKGNNYVSGDFSTNHWRFSYSYHWANLGVSHKSVTIGYQHEIGDSVGMFRFIPEQNLRYGKHRLIGIAQWQFMISDAKFINQMKVRTDIEYILDKNNKLSDFPYDNKYRLGIHGYIEVPIYAVPALGFLFHYYFGRDYLNIRYDDPVQVFQFGITLEVNRFTLQVKDFNPTIN